MKHWLTLTLLCGLLSCTTPVLAGNATSAEQVRLVPTYECIGIYAPFSGDDNDNCSAAFEWRMQGEPAWNRGADMVKDRRAVVTAADKSYPNPMANQFRASMVGLDADTMYEVRVVLSDPDGVQPRDAEFTPIRTRSDRFEASGRVLYVARGGADSNSGSERQPFRRIQAAVDAAQAGDTVLVRGGTYAERVRLLKKQGQAGSYIVVAAAAGERPVLDAGGSTNCGFSVEQSRFIVVRGFEISNAHDVKDEGAVAVSGSSDVVIDGNLIHGFHATGVRVHRAARVTIQNNRMIKTTAGSEKHIVNIWYSDPGNHVIRNNDIRDATGIVRVEKHYWDAIGGGPNFSLDGFVGNDSDIYGNRIEGSNDDQIECEGAMANVRVFSNTLNGGANGQYALAMAPVAVGPIYIFRNIGFGFRSGFAKQGQHSTGHQFYYHNTFYSVNANGFTQSNPGVSNVVCRNNIFHTGRYVLEYSDAAGPNLSFNYDNLFTTDSGRFIKWPGNQSVARSFELFRRNTGNEASGFSIDATQEWLDTSGHDFRLKPGSRLSDQGMLLPGFNGPETPWAFTGSGPDLGALEGSSRGAPAPE